MKKIYACLLGKWYCLNDDPNCVIGDYMESPYIWYEDGAKIASKVMNDSVYPEGETSYYNSDYVKIHYNGKDYRINPIFIQIITD